MASLHYLEDASLNAVLLLQKSAFQSQAANLEKLFQQQSKSAIEIKLNQTLPNVLTRRTLAEDLQDLKRNADNEELIIMTMLDSSGKLSLSSRVTEFIVLLTRLTKVDHRALCIQILTQNISKECEMEFVQNGGLRVIRRWIKNAETEENVEELKRLVKLCKKLPFIAQTVKVTEIGKAIKKLLKFKHPSTDPKITALYEDVNALISSWSEQARIELQKTVAPVKPESEVKPPSEFVSALSDRMVRERGLPSEKEVLPGTPRSPAAATPSSPRSSTSGGIKHSSPSASGFAAGANSPAPSPRANAVAPVKPAASSAAAAAAGAPQHSTKALDLVSKLKSFANNTSGSNDTILKTASTDSTSNEFSVSMDVSSESVDDLPRETAASPFAAAAAPSSPVTLQTSSEDLTGQMDVVPPTEPVVVTAAVALPKVQLKINIVRDAALAPTAAAGTSSLSSLLQTGTTSLSAGGAAPSGGKAPLVAVSRASRKSTDMAEGACKLLASRAAALSEKASESNGSASGSTVSKEDVPVVRKGGLKKPAVDGEVKIKRSIQWADSTEGGMLRQIHTIEVEKIKSSTANYKSHKDLVKKEKQLEKETHLSKYQDAMHKNTEWRSPPALKLSVEVLENSGNPVKSAEREAQTKRLGHVLEVRYLDDSLIPLEPDESLASIDGPPSVDDSLCAVIPWYQPGTEPVPQSSSGSGGGGRGGVMMNQQQHMSGGLMMNNNNSMMMMGGGDFNSSAPMNYNAPHHGGMNNSFANNNTNNRAVGGGVFDEMDALISALPLSLQRLNRDLLLQIVQDQSLLLALLNFDGSVNESRVAALQEKFYRTNGGGPGNSGGVGFNSNQNFTNNQTFMSQPSFNPNNNNNMNTNTFNLLPSAMGDSSGLGGGGVGGARPRTRWGDVAPVNNNMMMMDGGMNLGGGVGGGGGFNNDWNGPGGNLNNLPMMNNNNNIGSGGMGGNSSSSGSTGQKKVWTMPKTATACRFFNTAKGCQFGDKCGFGHFAPGASSSGPGPLLEVDDMSSLEPSGAVGGSTRWGPGGLSGGGLRRMGPGGASGPGARRMGDFDMGGGGGDGDAKRMRL